MAESQDQDTNDRQASTAKSQSQRPAMAESSQSHASSGSQKVTRDPNARCENSISVWAAGGYLMVDVGGEHEQGVRVPNPHGRAPTREEIYQALIAAGHHERANEHADRAYGNVSGTGPED